MSANTVFYGWKRSLPGREGLSASHFEDFVRYLAGLQQEGMIDAFEPVLCCGVTGAMLQERMTTWVANIPR